MKASARNLFSGKVTAIRPGAINTEVELTTAGGDKITAIVTQTSVQTLELAVGKEAFYRQAELPLEQARRRIVTDRDEDAVAVEAALLAGARVLER